MAQTLLDMLRARRPAGSDAAVAPAGATTQDLAKQIVAGGGKAVSGGDVGKVSLIPEQLSAADTRDQLANVADTSAAQSAQETEAASGVASAETRSSRELAAKMADVQSQARRSSDQMLAEYESGQKTLRGDKDKADAEQLATNIRLGNDKYINDLQTAATHDLITDQASFKKAFYEKEFSDSMDLFGDAQAFRKIQAMDSDEFSRNMSTMKMEDAVIAYKRMLATRKAQAPYAAAQGILGSATAYTGRQKAKEEDEEDDDVSVTNTDQGVGETSPWASGTV